MISRARGSEADAGRSKASGKKSGRKKKKAAAKATPAESDLPPESDVQPESDVPPENDGAEASDAPDGVPAAADAASVDAAEPPATAKKRGGGKRRRRKKSEEPPAETASRIAELAAEAEEATSAGATEEGTAETSEVEEKAVEGAASSTPAPAPTLTPEDEAELPHLEGDRLRACIESILFASPEPVTRRRLYRLLPEADKAQIRDALLELEGELLTTHRGYFLVEDSSGFRFLSKAEFAPFVARLRGEKRKIRLSAAAFETLAVIAYRQPARRADLEAIRGVQCGAIIKNLMEWNLLRVVGHDDSPGRPLLYGTTGEFLEMLGLAGLNELPEPERLRERGEDRGLQVLDRIIEEGGAPQIAEGTEGAGEEAAAPTESEAGAESASADTDSEGTVDSEPSDRKAADSKAADSKAADSKAADDASGEDEFDLDLEEDEQ